MAGKLQGIGKVTGAMCETGIAVGGHSQRRESLAEVILFQRVRVLQVPCDLDHVADDHLVVGALPGVRVDGTCNLCRVVRLLCRVRFLARGQRGLGEADPASRIHTWHDLGNVYQLKGDFDSALGDHPASRFMVSDEE